MFLFPGLTAGEISGSEDNIQLRSGVGLIILRLWRGWTIGKRIGINNIVECNFCSMCWFSYTTNYKVAYTSQYRESVTLALYERGPRKCSTNMYSSKCYSHNAPLHQLKLTPYWYLQHTELYQRNRADVIYQRSRQHYILLRLLLLNMLNISNMPWRYFS